MTALGGVVLMFFALRFRNVNRESLEILRELKETQTNLKHALHRAGESIPGHFSTRPESFFKSDVPVSFRTSIWFSGRVDEAWTEPSGWRVDEEDGGGGAEQSGHSASQRRCRARATTARYAGTPVTIHTFWFCVPTVLVLVVCRRSTRAACGRSSQQSGGLEEAPSFLRFSRAEPRLQREQRSSGRRSGTDTHLGSRRTRVLTHEHQIIIQCYQLNPV